VSKIYTNDVNGSTTLALLGGKELEQVKTRTARPGNIKKS
jgi:hypothetical protein